MKLQCPLVQNSRISIIFSSGVTMKVLVTSQENGRCGYWNGYEFEFPLEMEYFKDLLWAPLQISCIFFCELFAFVFYYLQVSSDIEM